MNAPSFLRKPERIRHTQRPRLLDVRRAEPMSPGFVRVTLGGPDLEGFTSLSFDDHIKIFLADDRLSGSDAPDERRIMRDFTPRSFDPEKRELTVEFALHGEGAATTWAARAAPGQQLRIGGPRGSFVIPVDYDWHLLIGDETALPAISRRLEELPPGANVITFIQLTDPADQRTFKTEARWVGKWTGPDPDSLVEAIRKFSPPPGEGFAWAAGEAKVISAIRTVLVATHGLDKEHIRAAAYWKRGTPAHHETFAD